MRGLGRRHRDLTFTQTDTNTGVSQYIGTVFTDGPDFSSWNVSNWCSAMSVPSAWRGAVLVSSILAGLKLEAKRMGRDGFPVRLDPQPPLLTNPTPGYGNPFNIRQSWALDYLWHGNCVAIVASRDPATGWPTSLLPVPIQMVQIAPYFALDDYGLPLGPCVYQIGSAQFGPQDVFHVAGPRRPGEFRGMGVLEAGLSTIQVAKAQIAAANPAVAGIPTGVLQTSDPDVTTGELQEAKREWLTAQGAPSQSSPWFVGARTIAALPPGITFQPLSWNPDEMQMIEARKFSDVQMAQFFGLPLRYVAQEVGGLTYSSPGADGVDLLKFTMNGHLTNFEQEWSRLMPRGTWAEYAREGILEADPQTRTTIDVASLAFLTKDEVRAGRGLRPLPPEPAPAPVAENPTDPGTLVPGDDVEVPQ